MKAHYNSNHLVYNILEQKNKQREIIKLMVIRWSLDLIRWIKEKFRFEGQQKSKTNIKAKKVPAVKIWGDLGKHRIESCDYVKQETEEALFSVSTIESLPQIFNISRKPAGVESPLGHKMKGTQ